MLSRATRASEAHPQRAVDAVVGEREPAVAAVDVVALAPAGADHVLGGAADGPEALEVWSWPLSRIAALPAQRLPERVDVALLVAVLAGVEARAVHEHDRAAALHAPRAGGAGTRAARVAGVSLLRLMNRQPPTLNA